MISKKTMFGWLFIVLGSAQAMNNTSAPSTYSVDVLLAKMGQSKGMAMFNKYLGAPIRNLTSPTFIQLSRAATSEFQKLGKEAQNNLNIPEDQQVPIKRTLSIITPYDVAAVAEPDAICVNGEGLLKNAPYGVKRCALFHEAVHVKYHDASTALATGLAALVGPSVSTYKLLKFINPTGRYKGAQLISTLTAGLSTSYYLVGRKFLTYCERRADTEGFYATQCSTCVKECANAIKNDHDRSTHGYLQSHELKKISSDLERDKKLCTYHKEQTSWLTNLAIKTTSKGK